MEGVLLGGITLQYVMRRKRVGGLDFTRTMLVGGLT